MRARLLVRQATSSPGASVAIAVVVAIAAALFAAWPQLSRAVFADEIGYRSGETSDTARALTGRQVGGWPVHALDGSLAEARDDLDAVVDSAGPLLRPLLGRPELLLSVDLASADALTVTGDTVDPPGLTGRELRFRAIPGLEEHVRLVEGAAPEPWPGPSWFGTGGGREVPPVPVMLSVATAERLGVVVGDVLVLEDARLVPPEGGTLPLSAVVSGVFEATDPSDSYWQHQLSGLEPLVRTDPQAGDFAIGAAYTNPESVGLLQVSTNLRPRTDVWIPLAAGDDDPAALLDELIEVTSRQVPLGDQEFGGVRVELETALVDVLRSAITSQRGAAAVLALVAAGPVGVMFALLALACRLSVVRRRDTLALASARGGAPVQIRGALGLEGLVIGLPSAALGAAVASLLTPGPAALGDLLLPLLAGVAPGVFLAGAALPSLRTQRHDLGAPSRGEWRWVVEVLVVAVAAGAVYLLLSRGLQATTSTTVDPLATATPLLVSLAAAVLATRLFPVPMRAVHAVMRRRRDLAGFLGSARAIRETGAGLVPMLALLVATSIAVFSTTMLTTLQAGVAESTRASTGADVRLVGPPYEDETVAAIAALPDVAATARVLTLPATRLTEGTTTRQVTLLAVDTAVLGDVQADVDGAVELPGAMDTLVDGRVPVVVSEALGVGAGPMNVQLGSVVDLEPVATAPSAAGLVDGALWAVVDLDLLREVTGQNLVPRMTLVALRPGADSEAAGDAIAEIVGGVGTIATTAAVQSDFLASPSAVAMQRGFVVTLALSTLQSVLALVLTLVLAAPARGRLIAVLRTLGTSARDARRLVSWEVVPLAATALVAGTVLGLALPHLVVATVDLSTFAGRASPPVVYDWARLGLVLAGVVAVVATTLLAATAVARRLSLTVLRIGDAT